MKTVTKNSLDKLSMIMPVLSESEQNVMVGGTEYYSMSGDIFSQNSGIIFRGTVCDGYTDVCFIDGSAPLPTERVAGIATSLSDDQIICLLKSRVASGIYVQGSTLESDVAANYNPITQQISMNMDKIRSVYANGGNFVEILGDLNHELAHQATVNILATQWEVKFGVDMRITAEYGTMSTDEKNAWNAMVEYSAYRAEANCGEFTKYSNNAIALVMSKLASATITINNFNESSDFKSVWDAANNIYPGESNPQTLNIQSSNFINYALKH